MSRTLRSSTTKTDPDARLIELCRRHTAIWDEWDSLMGLDAKAAEHDPRVKSWSSESFSLELQIVGTPACTAKGLAEKRPVIDRADVRECFRGGEIVDAILQLDAERVGAAG